MSPIKTRANKKPNETSTQSNKRIISPESREYNNRAKKQKSAKMSTKEFEELKNLITMSSNAIEKKIDDSQGSLEQKITDLSAKVNTEVLSLRNSVDSFKEKIGEDIVIIRNQITEQSFRIDNTEDDIQRIKLAADLRLTGFPARENENLIDLFCAIESEIGCEGFVNTNPFLERVHMRNITTGQFIASSTVIIHFASVRHKQVFYSHYLNAMPLKAEKFGFPKDKKLIIGENLTKKNAQIFKQAILLKKNNKLAQVFSEDGLVKVKVARGKEQRTHTIRNATQLDYLIASVIPANNQTGNGAQNTANGNNAERDAQTDNDAQNTANGNSAEHDARNHSLEIPLLPHELNNNTQPTGSNESNRNNERSTTGTQSARRNEIDEQTKMSVDESPTK